MRIYAFVDKLARYAKKRSATVAAVAILSVAAGAVVAQARTSHSYIRIATSLASHTPNILTTLIPTLHPTTEPTMTTPSSDPTTPNPSPSASSSPSNNGSSIHIESNNTGTGSTNQTNIETNSGSCTSIIKSDDENINIHTNGQLKSDPQTGTYTVNGGKNCSVNISSTGNNTDIQSSSSSQTHVTSNSSSSTHLSIHSSTSNH